LPVSIMQSRPFCTQRVHGADVLDPS
jgi:hypothetical protein